MVYQFDKLITVRDIYYRDEADEGGLHAEGIPMGDTRRLNRVSQRKGDSYTDITDFH